MRKIKMLVWVVLLLCTAFVAYRINMDMQKQLGDQVLSDEVGQEVYDKVKKQVDDTAIIRKAMKAVGIMGVLEGQEEYKQLIEEENWFSYRGISIDWQYRFAIAMNLEDIDVQVVDDVVNVDIDRSKLFIWFIEKSKDSTSKSQASWLAEKYSSQELNALDKAVLDKVETRIKESDVYWDEALRSLQANIIKLCNELGYYSIDFTITGKQLK